MAAAVGQLLREPVLRRRLGAAARGVLAREHDWTRQAHRTLALARRARRA